MSTEAWVNGITPVDAAHINPLMQMQSHKLIHTGALITEKTGSGVSEFTVDTASRAMRFTMAGPELGYLAIQGKKAGSGADLTVEIRSSTLNPDGSSLGVLIDKRVVPKEFISAAAGYIIVPFGLTGLTPSANYWAIVNQAGDTTNHITLVGEASQDASHPTYYRNGASGAWTVQNAIHRKAYDYSISGDLIAGIYDGRAVKWLEYGAYNLLGTDGDCEDPSKWSAYNASIALDSIKVFGASSLKVTATAVTGGNLYKIKILDFAKYYLFSGYVKNGNCSAGVNLLGRGNGSGYTQKTTPVVSSISEYTRQALKFSPSDFGEGCTHFEIDALIQGGIGQYAYVDGVKVTEITATEYTNDSVDVLMARYPFSTDSDIALLRVKRYIPAPDGVDDPGIRQTKTLAWADGIPREGGVF